MAFPLHLLYPIPNAGRNAIVVNPAMVMATVTQGAIVRLTRAFRQMRAPSNLCFLNLPLDNILMITTHLDESALVSLALTCQSLHCVWERRSVPLQLAEKEKLLLFLEKDIPFLYYCHHCTKLHRWHGRWSRSVTPWHSERLPCKRNIDKQLYLPHHCLIPYHWARLVMNRHLYGPKHGLPLHALNERARSSYSFNEVEALVSRRARIFNDQLLLMSVISMTHLQGDSELLRTHIDSHGHRVCEHLTLGHGIPTSIPIQLPELAKKGNAPGQFLACGPAFGSCIFCLTDYSIDIIWQGARKGYNIEVLVHSGLGDCRTPFSWHWRIDRTRVFPEKLRSAYSPDYGPGSVRDQWNKAGSETTNGIWPRAIW